MELTEKNIAQLYQFTKDHYVDHYDLQTELVDHLAADIEGIWSQDSSITFEQARDSSFKKFGIFGFGEVVEEKQKALSKQYWKEVWKEFIQFFKLPKIVLTLFFGVGTYYLFSLFNSGYFIIPLLTLSMFIYPMIAAILYRKKVMKRNKATGKKWQIDDVIFQMGIFPYIFTSPYIQFSQLFTKPSFTSNQLIFLSTTFVLFNLFFYISRKIVSPAMQKKMVKLFPEYELG